MSTPNEKDNANNRSKLRIVEGPVPHIARGGRKTMYRFWEIERGKSGVFSNTNIAKMNAAIGQYKKKYGGEYTCRTLPNDEVLVHCYSYPKKKHPTQIEEEYLAEQEAKAADEAKKEDGQKTEDGGE